MRARWKSIRLRETILNSVLLLVLAAFCLGSRPACRPPPNLECNAFNVHIPEPGMCADLFNPCSPDGSWAEVDHFRLFQEPDGFFIRGREGEPVARQICVSETVDYVPGEEIEIAYLYTEFRGRRRTDYGEGFVTVTIGNMDPLQVVVSAVPDHIDTPGESVQLDATPVGGTPPYTYLWMSDPSGVLRPGTATLKNPVVQPTEKTVFTVALTDSDDGVAVGNVEVTVGFTVTATATPDTIDAGESAQLQATTVGGAPPYAYSWVPLSALDDWNVPNPVATPDVTTTYQVTVHDSGTNIGVETTRVNVRIETTVTATPPTIALGNSSQLEVTVAGGAPPYTYSWSPSHTLGEDDIFNPVATPQATTTYYVTVTDAFGQVAIRPVTVTVDVIEPVVVTITATPDTISVWETALLEASATGGVPPYTIFWVPPNYLDLTDEWNPIFSGIGSMDYEARVQSTMGFGQSTVRINVRMDPIVTADPPSISVGGTSQLMVVTDGGGRSPFAWSWTPTAGLTATNIPNPVASPTETTEYVVTVTDLYGQVAVRGVTVEVSP